MVAWDQLHSFENLRVDGKSCRLGKEKEALWRGVIATYGEDRVGFLKLSLDIGCQACGELLPLWGMTQEVFD